ncbi:MAG: hypothetical protein ROO76_05580 [Terriglobia bacterium]|jgi:hypothetical protein|nr:hypothetical protein [Terriglobia bacterium]
MTLGRQIFENTIGKILLPWINLGFTGAVAVLAMEMLDGVRSYVNA